MAPKGSQPRNGLDRKTNKQQNVIPGSSDASFIESMEEKGKSEQNFQSNGDFPFRSCNPFAERAINTESVGIARNYKRRPSDVHLREKSGDGIKSSERADMYSKLAGITKNNLLSDSSKLTETNGVDHNCNITNNLFGSSFVGSTAAIVGSLHAISDWSFRYASYVLKIACGWIEHQKPRFSPFISYLHSTYDYGIARIKFVYPVICTRILHFGKLVLLLSAFWLDCSIRGLSSFLHLGTASVFTILWCSLLSFIAMVGFIKLLVMVVSIFFLFMFFLLFPIAVILETTCGLIILFDSKIY